MDVDTIASGPMISRIRASRPASASSTPSTVIAPWMSYQRPSTGPNSRSLSMSSPESSANAAAVTVPPGSALPTSAPRHSAASRNGAPGARNG